MLTSRFLRGSGTPVKLAFSRPSKLFVISLVLFVGIAFVLASPLRAIQRVTALLHQIPIGSNARPLTTGSMAHKSFKKPPQAPPLFTGTPDSVIEDTNNLIDRSRSLMDKIAAEIKPADATFENVLLPMARDDDDMGLKAHIIGFYKSVSTNAELRAKANDAEQLMDKFGTETALREDIYRLVDAVKAKGEKLDPESQRLLEKSHKDFIRSGMSLPTATEREKLKEIKDRIDTLANVFTKNLNDEAGGIWFDPVEVDGVPADLVASWSKGEGENEGKVRMTFKYPDFFPTMMFAKNPDTRKKVLVANENKLPQSIPLFKEVIERRDEAARFLGYKDHATFVIEDKMAKSPQTVDDFLGNLKGKLMKGGQKEREALTELKKSDLASRGLEKSFDGHYYVWDQRFYNRLMLERDYQVDQEKLAEYFPLGPSIEGMLELFEKLFGLSFTELSGKDRDSISPSGKGEDIVWHPDCKIFSVWDSEDMGGEFVGYLYLDLHPREGKYGHAANFNLQPGFITGNGTRRYPVTALVCNFSKPTKKKPSLLKHDEVTTLFHELGHGIHDLVSRTRYSRFHGTNVVRDFVEAPSQMLEYWCWTPSQLKSLSHHYSTLSSDYEAAWRETAPKDASRPGEQLPDDLIQNLIRTKHVNGALFNLRQLHFGMFDMAIHEPKSHAEVETMDFSKIYNKIGYDLTKLDTPAQMGEGFDWGRSCAHFQFPNPLGPLLLLPRHLPPI